MRMVLFLTCCALVSPTFGQSNCFDNCLAAVERAKSGTLTRSVESSIEITNRIVQGLVGCEAPEFDVVAVDGKRLKLSALKGKVVVLNFWFIGCAPCIAELPALNKLVDEYKGEDVVFIAFGRIVTLISVNSWRRRSSSITLYPQIMILQKAIA
jgi:thiol-disulfide isomerase/thioredoxin